MQVTLVHWWMLPKCFWSVWWGRKCETNNCVYMLGWPRGRGKLPVRFDPGGLSGINWSLSEVFVVLFGILCYWIWGISTAKPTRCTSFSNLFYFVVAIYRFRTVFPSVIKSLRLYIQHQVYVKQSAESVWHTPDAVCTVLDSWWWTKRPSETCRVLFQNKINSRNWCISLVLL
jgi:hypothetical protein